LTRLLCDQEPGRPIATERLIDTLVLARRKHPGGHNTLDDLWAD
jgi:DNA polymerase III epsilon subunit-like protein